MLKTGLLLLVFLLAGAELAAQSSQVVLLAGYKLDPPVPTAAAGTVTVTVNGDSLSVEGSFSDLSAPYLDAGIYYVRDGQIQNKPIDLTARLSQDKQSGSFEPSRNTFRLSEGLRALLKEGKLYVYIHSEKYRHGEIRGAIAPMR